ERRLETDPLKTLRSVHWLAAFAAVGLLAFAWRSPLAWMYDRWMYPESYYSHGLLVPFVALYFVHRDRHALARLPLGATWPGLAMLLAGVLLLIASGRLVVFFT